MMSMPPKASTAVCTNRSPKSSSVTLPTQATASPPLPIMSATVCSAGSASRSLTTTRAPSPASLRAISRPIPRPEPDTNATLFCSLLIDLVLLSGWVFVLLGDLVQRRDRLADQLDVAVFIRGLQFQAHALLAVFLKFLHDLAGTAHLRAQLGN